MNQFKVNECFLVFCLVIDWKLGRDCNLDIFNHLLVLNMKNMLRFKYEIVSILSI